MDNEITDQYIIERLGELPQENINRIRATMQKYGENRWWELEGQPEIVGFYQLFEPVLIMDCDDFMRSVSKLIGRAAWNFEFGSNVEGLRQEALEAIKRFALTGNYKLSDRKSSERDHEAVRNLEDLCEKKGKQFVMPKMSSPDEPLN